MKIKNNPSRRSRNLVYASAKDMPNSIYAGAYLGDYGYIYFDWDHDNYDQDIVALNPARSGSFDSNGVQYFFAYTYIREVPASEKKSFRNYIKHLGQGVEYVNAGPDQDVEKFVQRGVMNLDRMKSIESFQATVHVRPTSKDTIVDYMGALIADSSNSVQIGFELVKQMYRNVTFDKDKAYEKMMSTHKYTSVEAKQSIEQAEVRFQELKKSSNLFEMKKFLPRELRDGFENYLKFKNKDEEFAYRNLQGVDVLIYDDFLTSGATIREVIRYLRAINDKNTLTVFVLIKQ